MDNFDSVETDIVVATRTSVVEDSVAHISKTYAAAGCIVAVEEGKLNLLDRCVFAELLIVVTIVEEVFHLGCGHLTCNDTFSCRSST